MSDESGFQRFKGTEGYIASPPLIDAVNCAIALERPPRTEGPVRAWIARVVQNVARQRARTSGRPAALMKSQGVPTSTPRSGSTGGEAFLASPAAAALCNAPRLLRLQPRAPLRVHRRWL